MARNIRARFRFPRSLLYIQVHQSVRPVRDATTALGSSPHRDFGALLPNETLRESAHEPRLAHHPYLEGPHALLELLERSATDAALAPRLPMQPGWVLDTRW